MIKRVFPVAVVALALSAGGAFAEPPMAVTEANMPGVDDHRSEQLTETDMVSVTGRGGACTETVQGIGILKVALGFVSRSHPLVILGQITIGLAPFVCA